MSTVRWYNFETNIRIGQFPLRSPPYTPMRRYAYAIFRLLWYRMVFFKLCVGLATRGCIEWGTLLSEVSLKIVPKCGQVWTVKNVYENGNYDVEPILQTGPFSTVKSTSADPWICTLIISTNHNLSKRHKTNRNFSKKTSENISEENENQWG